jgi:hypothetical protein
MAYTFSLMVWNAAPDRCVQLNDQELCLSEVEVLGNAFIRRTDKSEPPWRDDH